MDDAMSAVAAELTAQLLTEAASNGDTAAAEVIQREIAEAAQPVVVQPVAAASVPVEPVQAPAPVVEVAAPIEIPDYTPKLSDELKELLEEPDFEEEAAQEVAAALESDEYGDEYLDPEVAKKLRTLEKRNKFLEEQVVAKSRKGWINEQLEAYPRIKRHPELTAELRGVAATSRRAFAREAAKLNDKYEELLGPIEARLQADRAAIAAGAVTTAREEVAAAWGKPASDTLPPIGAAQQEALAKARKAGSLKDSIKVLMDDKPLL